MNQQAADNFAQAWLEAWNTHDLDAIVSHYADDIEFVSPFAVALLNEPEGKVVGLPALRDYFAKGLAAYPDLSFQFDRAVPGLNSLTLLYTSVRDLYAAEFMQFNQAGKVCRVVAHYSESK